MPAAMSTTPRARGRSSHRRARCRCLAANKGDSATPCCTFNPLRSLFRCPGRDRSRSRSRSKHRQRTPSKVRDALTMAAGAQQQQTQEEEPSFFAYTMPNHSGIGATDEHKKKKKKKHRKPRMPSFGSCFRRKKKERKQAKAAATVSAPRRPALTPAASLLTHPPGSPAASEKVQAAATPAVTQPPSPAPTEDGSTTVNSPAPTGRQPTTARSVKHSTRSPFVPQMQQQQPKQVEGLEIVEVATGERLSTHELGLIEMVGSSADNSAESSVKSSLDYVNEPPLPPAKRTVVERVGAAAVPGKIKSAESQARERFSEPLVAAAAEGLWAHDVACSRVHAVMLAETVRCSSS
ncbi:unnamed protein product [Miscanthus lutarioriparius]|uniref:Uncharacterized protein n=1 Tax=Miscanthus lutarioriparius TaxID=422564 RepID=A0A811MSY0_9POAL|nr:unnamed protein product [Miscanthus lutarioriparius]